MSDVNVRNVADGVLQRLREQADAEGVSFSEWVRQALADRAELLTPAELSATRGRVSEWVQPREDFDAWYSERLRRRRG